MNDFKAKKAAPKYLKKLTSIVDKQVVKKAVYITLKTKVNNLEKITCNV